MIRYYIHSIIPYGNLRQMKPIVFARDEEDFVIEHPPVFVVRKSSVELKANCRKYDFSLKFFFFFSVFVIDKTPLHKGREMITLVYGFFTQIHTFDNKILL